MTMAKIQKFKDYQNVEIYPVTHERAVKDSTGETLEHKLERFFPLTYTTMQQTSTVDGYFHYTGEVRESTTVKIYKYAVSAGGKYAFSGRKGATDNLYFVAWFDSNDSLVKLEPYKGNMDNAVAYTKQRIDAPTGATQLWVNVTTSQSNYNHIYSVSQEDTFNDAVKKEDIVDNLSTPSVDKPLSANQGMLLGEVVGKYDTTQDNLYVIVDNNNRVLFYVKNDGTTCIPKLQSPSVERSIEELNESVEQAIDELHDEFSNLSAGGSAYHTQEALLLRKHINDTWPYYLAQDNVSDPQSFDTDSYLDQRMRAVDKTANKLIFVTDTHYNTYTSQYGTMNENDLMAYVKKRLNIPKVVFGGDANGENFTKYKAHVIFTKYYNSALSAFGKDFIPVIGDHDNNTFTTSGITDEFKRENFYDFQHVVDVALEQIQSSAVFDNELINQIDTLFSGETEDTRNELRALLKTHYYVDDAENKTRYIVLFSGTPQEKSWLQTFLHSVQSQSIHLLLQFDFIYRALMSIPEGYSVVFTTHKIPDCRFTEVKNGNTLVYRGTLTVDEAINRGLIDPSVITDTTVITRYRGMESPEEATANGDPVQYNLSLCKMISAFKAKRAVTITNYHTSSTYTNLQKMYASGDHIYDFSNAPTAFKVFGLTGHHHCDSSHLAGTIDGVYRSFYYEQGMTMPDDAILWIQFNTANNQRNHSSDESLVTRGDGPDATGAVMTSGTVYETSFDVVTWYSDRVVCTRFGGGNRQERTYNY